LLENRGVDTVVLLLAPRSPLATRWQDSVFARAVERRVAGMPILDAFRVRGVLPLGGTMQRYVVLAK
jgi:hypothetical protein